MLGIRATRPTHRVFYGWWIVLAASVTMSMSSGLFNHGFGFYFEPLRAQFGWSRTVLSGAYSLTRIESGFLGPIEGYLIQRFGPRSVMVVGLIIFELGFVLFYRVNSLLTFYLAFLVLTLGSGLAGFNVMMTCINNWFRRMRARAISMSILGLSLGGVIFPPVLAYAIENFGWPATALGSGAFIVMVGIPLAWVIRYNPEPYGYLPDGDQPASEQPAVMSPDEAPVSSPQQRGFQAEYDFTIGEALRTRAFWIMSLGHALAIMVVSTIGLHQVPFLETDLGFSKALAARVAMVLFGVTTCGQLIGGFLGDRFPKQYIASATLLGHGGALFLLSTATSFARVILASVIQGLAWGTRAPITTAMRGDYFGRKSFPLIMGYSQAIMVVGMVLGTLFSGYLADQFSYSVGFKVIAIFALPGAVLFLFLKKPRPPARHRNG